MDNLLIQAAVRLEMKKHANNRRNIMSYIRDLLTSEMVEKWKVGEYLEIMELAKNNDVTQHNDFQKKFKSFYRVYAARCDSNFWDGYFKIFECCKNKQCLCLNDIFSYYEEYGLTDKVYFVFATDMLATINEDNPAYSNNVEKALRPKYGKGCKSKVEKALGKYAYIKNWYEKNLNNSAVRQWLKYVDEQFPECREISDVKKLDFILWTIGSCDRHISEFM